MKDDKKQIRRRAIASILCILLSAAVFSSELFVAHETNHKCSGEHCPICSVLIICHEFLSSLFNDVAAVVLIASAIYAAVQAAGKGRCYYCVSTPVTLKEKLSY